MPFSPPPAPPPDAVEVTEYKIKDQIYFFHDSEWRKGEVKDYEGSSDESPRYLVMYEATRKLYKMAACHMRMRGDGSSAQAKEQQTQ